MKTDENISFQYTVQQEGKEDILHLILNGFYWIKRPNLRGLGLGLLADLYLYLYHPTLFQAYSGVSNIAHLEMDLQRDGGMSPSALDEGDQLQELPFTPVHAPVITLGMNVPR